LAGASVRLWYAEVTMAKIQRLPLHVANQIAAGEVIERPSSVVKELVENSLDAGARRIVVEVEDGGRFLRVVDDGEGMDEADARLAFERFATSKLRTAEEIFQLLTMGFRGEALASIASIAEVECLTRLQGAERGTRVVVEGGSEPVVKPAGCPFGTAITVNRLFYNTPARLKFLRAPATEQGHIHDVLLGLALCHPGVSFQLRINGKEALATPGRTSLPEVVGALYGDATAQALLAVEHQGAGVKVWGLATRPDALRADRSRQFFFVNQRWVRHPLLNKAVEEAYGEWLLPARYPAFVLFLEVDPATVDINVHPAKKEVRLGHSQRVYLAVLDALRQAFAAHWTPEDYALDPAVASVAAEHVPEAYSGAPGPPGARWLGVLHGRYQLYEHPEGLWVLDPFGGHTLLTTETLTTLLRGGAG
jgi:DNA mismatch repair protein MutL